MSLSLLVTALSAAVASVGAQITIYGQIPLEHASRASATATTTGLAVNYTGTAAYDPTVLHPPALPNPMPSLQYTVWMLEDTAAVANLSIPQRGSFMGFSIEFSVVNQVLGKNSSLINVPFLNLMSNLVKRAGAVNIRLGGNSQETAKMVDQTPTAHMLEKDKSNVYNPTQTPPLVYTSDVIYLASNISEFTNVRWYIGLPFKDLASPTLLSIGEWGQQVLGDKLLAIQAGNEPDLYLSHNHRTNNYGPWDFFGEFGQVIEQIRQNPNMPRKDNLLIGPSVSGTWTPEMVWETGFLPAYASSLYALAVEYYPTNNCFAQFGLGKFVDPQTTFPDFLTHRSGQGLAAPYLNTARIAQEMGKPFLMFETNTASCGGLAGISDAFGAALWAADYAMQLAHSNFTGAMFHVGGQNVFYNPFTAAPTNQTGFHQWTVGPIYYSSIAIAEAFGSSNTSRITDTLVNFGNEFTPAYAIYENGAPARVAAFNYMTDPTGNSDATLTIVLPKAPSQVHVKYLRAESVSTKANTGNITWAGQTLGPGYGSDGRFQGMLDVKTFPCDTVSNSCNVTVPAPSMALVFLTEEALKSSANSEEAQTFATSSITKTRNTVTINPSALATSNGMNGKSRQLGSTSKGGLKNAASSSTGVSLILLALAGAVASILVM